MKTGTGFTASYTYEDHRNVKTSVANSFGNTAVSTYTYEYDELGRRKSVKNTGSAFNNPIFNIYGYNDRSEVTASSSFTGEDLANKNNPLADRGRAYNYDPIGNRKTASEASSNLTYTANSLNQYESISGGAAPETPAYDLDGNMTVSKGMVYSYNAENRLIEAAPQNPQQGSVKSTYIYDYMGRRARKTLYTYSSGSWQKQKDISFIYDGWNMVKEIEKASDSSPEVPAYYIWGLDLSQSMQGAGGVGGLIASVKAGNEYLYSFDANGNVGQMLKASDGSIAARYEYDPFGKTLFSEGPMAGENPYRFSTKYLDGETGLYYYGFRYYDAEMGRWINRDPMGEKGGINLQGFVINSSVNGFDMLGNNVNIAYRVLDIPILKHLFPAAGHVYLAFDNVNMDKSSIWKDTLKKLGYSEQDLYTFSFHPYSVRTKDSTGNRFSVAYTVTTYIDRNNEEADMNPYRDGSATKILVTNDPCEQVALFKKAHESWQKNPGGFVKEGAYSFLVNNCGSWAKGTVESANLKWPTEAYFLNGGNALNGPADYTGIPQTLYAAAVMGYQVYDAGYHIINGAGQVVDYVRSNTEIGAVPVRDSDGNIISYTPGVSIKF